MAVTSRPRPGLADRNILRHLDVTLLGTVVALAVIGLFLVYSATHQSLQALNQDTGVYLKRQLAWFVIALVAMALAAGFHYRLAKVYAVLAYAAMVLLLLLVRSPLGSEAKGAQRGFYLLGFQFTPSEWMKIALIVMLAAFLSEVRGDLKLRDVGRATALAAGPLFLVFIQPDVGTTIVLATIVVGLLIVSGAKARHLAVLAAGAVVLLAMAFQVGLVKDYQVARLTGFLDKEGDPLGATYNRDQSEIAIGSGGLFGTGYLQGTQTNLDFVPEQHTDFIFTVAGEEFGFMGAATLLLLFAVLLWRALRIAMLSKDRFGTYIAAGVASMLAIQVFVNVGMTLGIMPITGIPLPFVSYGGSSLVANFGAVGLLLNVHMRRAT